MMNLRLLAPEIQEELVTLDRVIKGRDSLGIRHMQSIALDPSWINECNYLTSFDLA
jgi:hypothetical protein